MKKLLFIFGTRPEAIKMAPIIRNFKANNKFVVKVCVTAQHREMLDQVLDFFSIKPDYDLNLMAPNQTLFDITARVLKGVGDVLDDFNPDLVFVQGDTTTAFVGGLAAYYKKIKIAHVEAGLRSGNLYSPFPEEANRKMVGHIADFHFAPTSGSAENLKNEGVTRNVYVVGNSVIDALFLGLEIIKAKGEESFYRFFNNVDFSKKIILITAHRRESFGEPFDNICQAIKLLSETNPNFEFVYPVHLNPNVQIPVNKYLSDCKNVKLISPLDYQVLLWIMNKSYLVITDSGGIQEEAPSLGKPVVVLRDVTERMEGINAGTAILVGTDVYNIISKVSQLINNEVEYNLMAKSVNPYGDGTTSERIHNILINHEK